MITLHELAALDADDWRLVAAGMECTLRGTPSEDIDPTEVEDMLHELFGDDIPGESDWRQIVDTVATMRSTQAADALKDAAGKRGEYMRLYMRKYRNGVE